VRKRRTFLFPVVTMVVLMLLLPVGGVWAMGIEVVETYYDNGKLHERYSHYIDEWGSAWKEGPYTSWNGVGLIDEVMQYYRNSRQGPYTRYLYAYEDFVNYKLVVSSVEQGSYEEGRKVGTWTITPVRTDGLQGSYEYAPYGNVLVRQREQQKYQNGYPWFDETCESNNGNWLCVRTEYHSTDSGKVRSQSWEEFTQGKIVQHWEGRHPSGTVSFAGLSYNGGRQGRWNSWADDGFLVRQTDYLNDQKQGLEIEYPAWEMSKVKDKIIREFKYGVKQGDEKRYSDGGNLSYHYRYVDGVREGEQRDYWGDLAPGKLFRKYFMKGGANQGLDEWYYQTGALHTRSQYLDGKLEGIAEVFYESGALDSRSNYQAGERHGSYDSFHENGHKAFHVNYEKDKASGTAQSWRGDGTLQSETTYVDGVMHGPAWYLGNYTFCDPTGGACGYNIPSRHEGAYGNGNECGSWVISPVSSDISYYRPRTEYYGACETLHVTNPDAPYNPTPAANVWEIRGRVTRSADGRPITGVQVYAGSGDPPSGCSGECSTTDNEGFYSLLVKEQKSYPLQFTAGGYYGHQETADMTKREYLTVNVQLEGIPPAKLGTPAVTKFTSKYGGVFLQSLPVSNPYSAAVNWSGGQPGTLRFTKNGTVAESAGGLGGGSLTFNMGSDFTAALSTTANVLTVEALGTDGKKSGGMTLNPIVIPLPAWSIGLGGFSVKEENGAVQYVLGKSWPEEPEKPFSAQINPETLGNTLWTAWSLFPLIGGKEFGIPPTQFAMEVAAGTNGVGSVSLGGKTGFAVGGGTIEGAVKGTGKVRYESGKGLSFAEASVNTGITGSVKREVGPVTLIPALSGATEMRFVGKFFTWFNNTVKIDGTVSVGTDLTLGLEDQKGQIGFKPAEGTITTGIELGMGSEVEAFKTRLSGGGTGKLMWQIPANPGYYKGSEFTLNAKLEVNWKLFSSTFEASRTFPQATAQALSLPAGFGPVPRTFLALGPYNHFAAPTTASRAVLAIRKPLEVTSDAVVTNIYPYAGPAVAMQAGRLSIAYVYNDPNDQPLQATEITILDWAGGVYTAPAPILNDTKAEFSPVLAYDVNGALIAVWERVKSDNFTKSGDTPKDAEADMERMASLMEIVYAVREPGGPWSAPAALTDNDYLDHAPLLARAADGSVLLVWRSNTKNGLIGETVSDTGAPTRLHHTKWNSVNKVFESPVDMGFDFIGASQFSLAYKPGEATLAFVRDGDGDSATTHDQEIVLSRFNGSAWAAPSAVTTDGVPDIAPQVLYDGNGQLQLAWRKGDTLVRRTDAASGATEEIRTGSAGMTFTSFRLFCAPDNRLVVVWQDAVGGQVDLYYVARYPATGSWSGDVRLTNDPELEQDVAGVFGPDGALHLVYGRETAATGQTDLTHLIYRLGGDLAITAADLSVDPTAPPPGSPATLRAVVKNRGDENYQNVAVRFYLGDPANGGQLIGSSVVAPVELKGGTQGEALLAWTPPENLSSYPVMVLIDPDNLYSEADENNNRASFFALKPDIEMLSARVDNLGGGSVDVVANLRNAGWSASPEVTVLFSVGGKELGVASVPRLEPGNAAEISRRYWSGTDFSGAEVAFEVTADPDNRIPEVSETNNRSGTLFVATPIASVVNDGLIFDPVAPGSGPASLYVTIRNEGSADLLLSEILLSDTTNFTIDLNGGPQPLGSLTTPIPAGESRTIGITLAPAGAAVGGVQLTIRSNELKTGEIVIPVTMEAPVAAAPGIEAPDNLDFGQVVVGIPSPVRMVGITNTGTADLQISSLAIGDAVYFEVDAAAGDAPLGTSFPTVVPPGARRTLAVRYLSQTPGSHTAGITISSNDPDRPSFLLTLTGTTVAPVAATPPMLVVTPLDYYFGTVKPGAASDPLMVLIGNGGETSLQISNITLTDTGHFQMDQAGGVNPLGNLPADIPPGESRTVTVTFAPSDTAGHAAELAVNSDDPANPSASVSLRGNDPFAGAADIVASPASIDFGEVNERTVSAPREITISNQGGKELKINDLTSSEVVFAISPTGGTAALGTLPATIPAGESRTVAVTFSPIAAGASAGTLTISSNDPDRPTLSLPLAGIGLHVAAPVMQISPPAVNFGKVAAGGRTASTLSITNSGDIDLTVSSLVLSDETHFTLTWVGGGTLLGSLPAAVPSEASRTVEVAFLPDAGKVFTATLTIGSNDAASPARVSLEGRGELLKGDLNGSGGVDLADALLALRLQAGGTAEGFIAGYAASGADVDGNGRLGHAESLFILQSLAGLRSAVVSLPESDHPYGDNEDRQWSYTLPGNPAAIHVAFDLRTETEAGYDFIHVTDGGDNEIEGSPFSGTDLSGRTVTVPGDTVKIRLTSDSDTNRWGFKVDEISAASP